MHVFLFVFYLFIKCWFLFLGKIVFRTVKNVYNDNFMVVLDKPDPAIR